MVNNILYRVFRSDKKKIEDVLYDINLLYKYINQNAHIIDSWCFQTVFKSKYWLYLLNYKWLTDKELDYLHQGVLNIILFRIQQHLEESGTFPQKVFLDIQNSLNYFSSKNETSVKLCRMVKDALKLAMLKQEGKYDNTTNGEIYKSITWTLKNTILKNTSNKNSYNLMTKNKY